MDIMEDGYKQPKSWHRWHAQAVTIETNLKNRGYTVIRAPIDAKTFLEWCSANGFRPNREGRRAYANWFAAQQVKTTK